MKRITAVLLFLALAGCARMPMGTAHILDVASGRMSHYAGYGFFVGQGCFIATFHQRHYFKGTPYAYSGAEEYRLEFLRDIHEFDITIFKVRTNKALPPSMTLAADFDASIFGQKAFVKSGADTVEVVINKKLATYRFSIRPYIFGLSDREFSAYKIEGGDIRPGKSGSAVVNSKGEVFAIVHAVMDEDGEKFGLAIPISIFSLGKFLKENQC